MRDSVEVFGASLSRCTRPHGPPRPEGFSTQRTLTAMAADGERVLKRALLLGGTFALGALAWGAATQVADGGADLDVSQGAHPP